MIKLKVTKNQDFNLFSGDTFSEKLQESFRVRKNNRLLRKGMSNISLKTTTEKKIRSQNFNFRSLKTLS